MQEQNFLNWQPEFHFENMQEKNCSIVKLLNCYIVKLSDKRQYNNIAIKQFFLFTFLISHFTSESNAQESKIFLEPSVYYGRIIKHTTPFPEIKNNTLTIAIHLTKQPDEKKLWHRLYPVSTFGIGILYSNFGDDKVLGSAIGLLPQLTFSGKKNKKIKFYYTLGTGLSYLNKPYHLLENETNNVIGSVMNVSVYLNFGAEWNLSPKFAIKPSLAFIHYSNGRAKLPNLGYNIPSVSLLGKIFLTNQNRQVSTDTTPPLNKKFHPEIEIEYGFNQLQTSRGPIYPIYGGKIAATKNLTLKNKLSVGIEYVFDSGIYSFMQLNEIFPEYQRWRASRLICFAAHEFLIGHLGLLAQGGFFLNKPFNTGTKFPTKLGIRYNFFTPYFKNHHNFFCGIYLAAHSFEADYVAVGVGYNY